MASSTGLGGSCQGDRTCVVPEPNPCSAKRTSQSHHNSSWLVTATDTRRKKQKGDATGSFTAPFFVSPRLFDLFSV